MNNTLNFLADRGGRFGRHGGFPWLSLVTVLVVGAAVAALVVWALRGRRGGAVAQPAATASAEAILAERLARSEIDPTEYRTLLGALRGETPVAAEPPAAEPAAAEPPAES